ncbi:hypothetical protein ACA910_021912 [Epithemia clementina (nom. ined.)]
MAQAVDPPPSQPRHTTFVAPKLMKAQSIRSGASSSNANGLAPTSTPTTNTSPKRSKKLSSSSHSVGHYSSSSSSSIPQQPTTTTPRGTSARSGGPNQKSPQSLPKLDSFFAGCQPSPSAAAEVSYSGKMRSSSSRYSLDDAQSVESRGARSTDSASRRQNKITRRKGSRRKPTDSSSASVGAAELGSFLDKQPPQPTEHLEVRSACGNLEEALYKKHNELKQNFQLQQQHQQQLQPPQQLRDLEEEGDEAVTGVERAAAWSSDEDMTSPVAPVIRKKKRVIRKVVSTSVESSPSYRGGGGGSTPAHATTDTPSQRSRSARTVRSTTKTHTSNPPDTPSTRSSRSSSSRSLSPTTPAPRSVSSSSSSPLVSPGTPLDTLPNLPQSQSQQSPSSQSPQPPFLQVLYPSIQRRMSNPTIQEFTARRLHQGGTPIMAMVTSHAATPGKSPTAKRKKKRPTAPSSSTRNPKTRSGAVATAARRSTPSTSESATEDTDYNVVVWDPEETEDDDQDAPDMEESNAPMDIFTFYSWSNQSEAQEEQEDGESSETTRLARVLLQQSLQNNPLHQALTNMNMA